MMFNGDLTKIASLLEGFWAGSTPVINMSRERIPAALRVRGPIRPIRLIRRSLAMAEDCSNSDSDLPGISLTVCFAGEFHWVDTQWRTWKSSYNHQESKLKVDRHAG